MTDGLYSRDMFTDYPYREAYAAKRSKVPQIALCAAAVGASAVGLWMIHTRPADLPALKSAPVVIDLVAAVPAAPAAIVAVAAGRVETPARERAAGAGPSLFDPALTVSSGWATFGGKAPLAAALEPPAMSQLSDAATPPPVTLAEAETDTDPTPSVVPPVASASPLVQQMPLVADLPSPLPVPLPLPRPADLRAPDTAVPSSADQRRFRGRAAVASVAPSAQPSFFERLFGQPAMPAMAYAATEEGSVGSILSGRVGIDRMTAVYDISAHTVTLPDGTRLEAHSGLGAIKDDPRGVTEHMRGATPPNTYDLSLREAPFHGVRALRLTPIGGTTFGREGLLAHTYMLRGHSGESNGCVVFKNYQAFLTAFESGQIRRLVVVAGR